MGIHPRVVVKCAGKFSFIQVVQYNGTDARSVNSKLSPVDVVCCVLCVVTM
jgi:hypothetical protein